MGKGDMRTKRGKIHRGTYGNTRRRKKRRRSEQPREGQEGFGGSSPRTTSPA